MELGLLDFDYFDYCDMNTTFKEKKEVEYMDFTDTFHMSTTTVNAEYVLCYKKIKIRHIRRFFLCKNIF